MAIHDQDLRELTIEKCSKPNCVVIKLEACSLPGAEEPTRIHLKPAEAEKLARALLEQVSAWLAAHP